MNNNTLIWLLPLLLLAFTACEPDTACTKRDTTSSMVVTIHADSIDDIGKQYTYTSWDSLRVQGVGSDTILYSTQALSQLPLELRPDTNVSAFLITYHQQTDTLCIFHTPQQHFISLACGCTIYHTIDSVYSTDTRVDSILIINASIETTAQENIRIYLHE